MNKNEIAISHIKNFIKSLIPAAVVEDSPGGSGTTNINVDVENNLYNIVFPRRNMDDFASASDNKNSDQYYAAKNNIENKLYIFLGNNGLISNYDISKALLEQKRTNYLEKYDRDIEFDEKLNEFYNIGLKAIIDFLNHIRGISDNEKDIAAIENILAYYKEKNTFDTEEISIESLMHLKAALMAVIITKEKDKIKYPYQGAIKKTDSEIYYIVSELKENPFPQIKWIEYIYDFKNYLDNRKGDDKINKQTEQLKLNLLEGWVHSAKNKRVFLAHKFNEAELRDKIEEALPDGFSIVEGKVEDLGRISDDILMKIKSSGFFIGLITKAKEFKEGRFSTSPWILMEIGTAIAYGKKVLILAEDCVDQEEYESKLQADCQYEKFDREEFDEKLDEVINRIKNEWNKVNNN